MIHIFAVLLDHGIYKELDQKFRLDYCQLWKALILLDSQKILELGEQFGVGKYAKYFPVIFTGRTIERYMLMTFSQQSLMRTCQNCKNVENHFSHSDIIGFFEIRRKRTAKDEHVFIFYSTLPIYSLTEKACTDCVLYLIKLFAHNACYFRHFILYMNTLAWFCSMILLEIYGPTIDL